MTKKNTTNTTQSIIETFQSLKSQDDSIQSIIKSAIEAVQQAEEAAKKEAELTALSTILNASTADLSSLSAEQIAVLTAVADGQKKAIYSAFKVAADLNAEIQALKGPKKAAKSAAKKITLKQAYACLQAYETIILELGGPIKLSSLLSEPIRFLRSNISKVNTLEQIESYESSFRASYLTDDYIDRLADFIGPRFTNDIDDVKSALTDAVKSANDRLLKLVP